VSTHVPQNRTCVEIEAHFQLPYLAYPSLSQVKELSLYVPLTELQRREMLDFQNIPSFIFQNSQNTIHFHVPQWGPYGESCPFPEHSFTYPSGFQVKQPHLHPVSLTELPQREELRFQKLLCLFFKLPIK
jgi:hypothetical protein